MAPRRDRMQRGVVEKTHEPTQPLTEHLRPDSLQHESTGGRQPGDRKHEKVAQTRDSPHLVQRRFAPSARLSTIARQRAYRLGPARERTAPRIAPRACCHVAKDGSPRTMRAKSDISGVPRIVHRHTNRIPCWWTAPFVPHFEVATTA